MRKIFKFTFIVGIIFSFVFFSFATSTQKTKVNCPKKLNVKTKLISAQNFNEFKRFDSCVYPELINLKSPVQGNITELRVNEGDIVSKGWVIGVVNDALSDDIKQLEEDVQKWKKILWNREHWKERSERAELQAKEKLDEFSNKLDEKKIEAEDYILKSPITGKIKSLNIEVGSFVDKETSIITFENNKKMFADVEFTEDEDKNLFSDGILIKVNIKEKGEETATVVSTTESKVVLFIMNTEGKLIEGDRVYFEWLKRVHKDVFVINKKNLLKDTEGEYVYVVTQKKVLFGKKYIAKKVYLYIVFRTEESVIVSKGLNTGDLIIGSYLECLKDGLKIRLPEKKVEVKQYKEVQKKVEKVKKVSKIKKINFGLKFGMISPSYSYTFSENIDYSSKSPSSTSVGAFFGYNFSKSFQTGLELNYNQKNDVFTINSGGTDYDLEINKDYLDILVYVRYSIPMKKNSKFSPFISLGPYYSTKRSGEWERLYNSEIKLKERDTDSEDYWAKDNYGMFVGLGLSFNVSEKIKFSLESRYELGLKNIAGVLVEDEIKINSIKILFAVEF